MSPLPGVAFEGPKPGTESICGGRDEVVADICHLFKLLLLLCRVNAVRKMSETTAGFQLGSWVLVSVGGTLQQRNTGP